MLSKLQQLMVLSLVVCCVAGPGSPPVLGQEDEVLARMAREHATDSPVPSPVAAEEPSGAVEVEEVVYADLEGARVAGYLARPKGVENAPGVLVIHEWWGLNDNIRAMARRLAGEGYQALAVDLYEGEVAEDRETARRLATRGSERQARLEENLRQARGFLESRGAGRIGVIGWCFGGGWSLRAALSMPREIDATVIYYGRLVTDPQELARLEMPILGIFGELDRGIPVATVREFEAALEEAGREASIVVYPDADHAFANPSGTRYHEAAAVDAWSRTTDFFESNLR